MKVASCSIVRLENLYIREFVEHQKNIGFDKVFIYDHNLPDGERLEEVIDDYIQSGFVEVIDFRIGHKMGPAVMEAFQHCWDNYRKYFDWILFCDNDEFLTFTEDKNVKEYLSRNVFQNVNIIKINWLCYDDNDLLYYDNRPLNERFTRLCNEENPLLFKENNHIKCIINCKTENIDLINGSAHGPNLTTNGKYTLSLKYYDSSKIVVDGGGNKLDRISQIRIQKIRNINYDLAYLKHFRMKTIEEYVKNKRAKLPEEEYKNLNFDLDLFFKYNRKTTEKTDIYHKLNKNIENAKDISTTCVVDNYKYNMKVASCSIVRLENLYIREFVEHQKNIGFDKVFIYDHNLPDGEHLEEVIDDYIQSGFVEVIDFRVGHKMGPAVMEAFQHCWDNYRKYFDWILFCDNDEFLTFTEDKNVKEYLSRNVFIMADIIKINWVCYDDNDLIYYDNRPLNERFTRLCNGNPYNFNDNHHIKSFINCKAQNIYWVYNTGFETIYCGGPHCPCRFIEPNKREGTYDSSKNIVNNKGKILLYQDQRRESKIKYLNFDLAYLKHFRMKTIEEYVINKRAKLPKNEYTNLVFDIDLFLTYNKETEEKINLFNSLIEKNVY